MPFDGIVTRAVLEEVRKHCLDGHVRKINQIGPRQLTIQVYANNENQLIYLSADPSQARIQLTNKKFTNPKTPPNFVMLLRKHIGQARIASIDQAGLDRTVLFNFDTRNELGDPVTKHLAVEAMGKHSNIILLDEDMTVIDAIQRVSHSMSRFRQVYPGSDYKIFPANKRELLDQDISYPEILETCKAKTPLFKSLYQNITGFSPIISKEICFRAQLDPGLRVDQLEEDEVDRLNNVLQDLVQKIRAKDFHPVLYQADKAVFHVFPLTYLMEEAEMTSPSISEVMDAYYSLHARDDRIGQLQGQLQSILSKRIDKTSRKLDRQREDYKNTLDKERFKEEGDLLAAHVQDIGAGDEVIRLEDFYHNNEERLVHIDPQKSPWDNVQAKYKRFSKLKRAQARLSKTLPRVQDDLNYYIQLRETVDAADDLAVLKEIRQEFIDQGLIKKKKKHRRKVRNPKKLSPLQFTSSSGKTIYVGRNNRQNDELTLKKANKEDYFFHSQTIPGAHVILVTNGEEISEDDILEAAWLAASHSSGRADSAVDIDYTQRKHVYKAKGAKPGMVYYKNFSTITVNPRAKLDLKRVE